MASTTRSRRARNAAISGPAGGVARAHEEAAGVGAGKIALPEPVLRAQAGRVRFPRAVAKLADQLIEGPGFQQVGHVGVERRLENAALQFDPGARSLRAVGDGAPFARRNQVGGIIGVDAFAHGAGRPGERRDAGRARDRIGDGPALGNVAATRKHVQFRQREIENILAFAEARDGEADVAAGDAAQRRRCEFRCRDWHRRRRCGRRSTRGRRTPLRRRLRCGSGPGMRCRTANRKAGRAARHRWRARRQDPPAPSVPDRRRTRGGRCSRREPWER